MNVSMGSAAGHGIFHCKACPDRHVAEMSVMWPELAAEVFQNVTLMLPWRALGHSLGQRA